TPRSFSSNFRQEFNSRCPRGSKRQHSAGNTGLGTGWAAGGPIRQHTADPYSDGPRGPAGAQSVSTPQIRTLMDRAGLRAPNTSAQRRNTGVWTARAGGGPTRQHSAGTLEYGHRGPAGGQGQEKQ